MMHEISHSLESQHSQSSFPEAKNTGENFVEGKDGMPLENAGWEHGDGVAEFEQENFPELAHDLPTWNDYDDDAPNSGNEVSEKPSKPEVKSDVRRANDGDEEAHPSETKPAEQNDGLENGETRQNNADVKSTESTDGKAELQEAKDKEFQELKEDYIDDIVKNSEVPETIDAEKAKSANFEKCSPEETAAKREEFNAQKDELIQQWEKENGQEWPTYQEDVYSSNGHLIRRAGDKYDAHHIQPLSMGGKNEASNITPLHAKCHYDRQGIHSYDSPYAKIEQKLGA